MKNTSSKGWYKIADEIAELNFNAGGLTEINVNGKTICLAKHNNQLFACTQKCPHAGGLLAEGYIDPLGNITCPLHKYKFNLNNGRNTSDEGYHLKTFRVIEKEDVFFVFLEDSLF